MLSPRKLKAREVAEIRAEIAQRQGNVCALCKRKFTAAQIPVLDHDHSTGAIRGVLHRGCNSLLGKWENNAPRYGVVDLIAASAGLAQYLRFHEWDVTGLIHPTHKTADEKRLLRNARARKARANKKETT